ncbi:MAG TPA: 30S ribosomal protein S7 [Myxococcota bacterium]|jgi:small subunit ribosomal protein S7|nr:30S ribosomal protein S7 [Myxococcota bacterium]
MPRRREVEKRNIDPDPKFNDRLVTKLINVVMTQGKKSIAEQIVYGAFDLIEARHKEEPIKVFKKAMENVKPSVEVKSRRVGGASYQVPIEVPANRRVALGLRWLRDSARDRSERTMREKLASELFDASQSRGMACKKREDTHRMAEANKAFAHYRW